MAFFGYFDPVYKKSKKTLHRDLLQGPHCKRMSHLTFLPSVEHTEGTPVKEQLSHWRLTKASDGRSEQRAHPK